MRWVTSLVTRVRESVWAPVLAKGAGVALVLVLLGVIGSGALDGWLSPPQAMAASRFTRAPEAPRSTAGPVASASGSATPVSSASASASASARGAVTSDGKIVLNLAGLDDLEKIPGVGKKKAQAILALRERLGGRFKSLNDLTRVRGIKRKFLERIKGFVVLDPPPEPAAAPSASTAP